MIGALGYWESNERNPFSGRSADFGRWVNQLYAFGLDVLLLVGTKELLKILDGVQSGTVTVSLIEKLEEASVIYPTAMRVFVEHRGVIPGNVKYEFLHDFKHPQDVLYCFGADAVGTALPTLQEKDKLVTIDYPHEDIALYSQEALTCVLYDRMVKNLGGKKGLRNPNKTQNS